MKLDEFGEPVLPRKATPRNSIPDPTRQIVMFLWPLLLLNGVLWIAYAHVPIMSALWWLMLLGSIFYMRRNG